MGALGIGMAAMGAISAMKGGTGAQKSESESQSSTSPVVIPRFPAVIPSITTGQGSRISVTPRYNTDQLNTSGAFGGLARATGGTIGSGGAGGIAGNFGGLFNPTVTQGGNAPEKPTAQDYETISNPVRIETGSDGLDRVKENIARRKFDAAKGRIDEWNSWLAGEGGPRTGGGEVQGPAMEALTGLGINVNIDPSIAQTRQELFTNLEGLKGNVNAGLDSIGGQIAELQALKLPEIDTAGFDQISEWGDTQRGQLLNIDQNLSAQIGQLDQMYQRLGQNEGSFIEARTSQMREQREQAHRDAARRGLSGPLSALATNPFDVGIADEAAKAQMDVEQARLQVREQQRMVEETRIGVQQQFEEVRRGQLAAIGEKFAQAEGRIASATDRAGAIGGLNEVLQGGQSLLQSIINDQTGLNQNALQQEFMELGLGAEIYQMVINSQLETPTAQVSSSSSSGESSTQGDIIGDVGSIFGGIGGAMAGGG